MALSSISVSTVLNRLPTLLSLLIGVVSFMISYRIKLAVEHLRCDGILRRMDGLLRRYSETPPENDADKAMLIDTLQDWKTERYKEIIRSGTVEPRPGVLRLMDEAKAAGRKLAVCSAATKSSVVVLYYVLKILLGWSVLKVLIASLQAMM